MVQRARLKSSIFIQTRCVTGWISSASRDLATASRSSPYTSARVTTKCGDSDCQFRAAEEHSSLVFWEPEREQMAEILSNILIRNRYLHMRSRRNAGDHFKPGLILWMARNCFI